MKKYNKTLLIVSIITVSVLFLAGLYYFIFSKIRSNHNFISGLKDDTQALIQKDAELRSIKSMILNTQHNRAEINRYLVPFGGEVEFLESIESLAKFSGSSVKFQSVDLKDEVIEKAAGLESLSIKLEGNGEWASLYKFLKLIELMPYKVVVRTVRMSHVEAVSKTEKARWNLIVEMEVLKDKNS